MTQTTLRFKSIANMLSSLVLISAVFCRADAGVNYTKKSVAGVSLYIIEMNLQNEKIIPVSASGMDYASRFYQDESFGTMAKRVNAIGAINGCYFDKTTKKPIGDVAVDGQRLHNGGGWAYFGIRNDGTVEFGTDNPVQSRVKWDDFQMGITCLPMIIKNGTVLINTNEDLTAAGFRDSHVFMNMPRSALAETKDGKLLLVASGNTKFPSFAKALKALGVVNAIGLDGGASTALYWGGKTVLSPGRKLTTILAVIKSSGAVKTVPKKENVPTYTETTDETGNKTAAPETTDYNTTETQETPSTSPSTGTMECQDEWFKDVPLNCESCKLVVKTMKESGESAMAACIEKYCKKKISNCK